MNGLSDWWKSAVIYQIYPRSFKDSNHDGVGDLNGIRSHLDYLSWLGVDAIWISPIYPSPNIDFGYDIANHCAIDPLFGTLQEFDNLVTEAHQRDLRIIMDLVLAHTSDQHPWFLQSKQDRTNPYHDYYIWADPQPGHLPPNNWQSVTGGKYWHFIEELGQYYGHMFYPQQPDLNWHNPIVQQEMLNIFRFWLDRDVDGFRLDVFSSYYKDKNLRNQPFTIGRRPFEMQQHIYDNNQTELDDALRTIRKLVDSYPNRYLVGEPFLPTVKTTARYVNPEMLHQAFHLNFAMEPWNPGRLQSSLHAWESALQPGTWPCHVLNNHDLSRSSSRFHCGESDARLKVAAAMLLTLRGTPFLYYGEEIGQRDITLSHSQIKDPVGKKYWPIYRGRDFERAPMQWNETENSGFSDSIPWLPVHPDFKSRNVKAQRSDPGSLLNWYRQLIALRQKYPAFSSGVFQSLTFNPINLLAYLRQTDDQVILVALNFKRKPINLYLGGELRQHGWKVLLSSNPLRETIEVQSDRIKLSGYEALILLQEDDA